MTNLDAMRAEIAALHNEFIALSYRLEAARTDGNEAEVRRLRPQLEEARERWRETEGVAALCEAALLTDRQPEGWRDLGRCQDALHELLYRHGIDEVGVLEVVEANPARVILVGRISWVETQSNDLVEATFEFDADSRTLKRLVVRAGEQGVGEDATRESRGLDQWSAHGLAERIALRPEGVEQWAVVIRTPSS